MKKNVEKVFGPLWQFCLMCCLLATVPFAMSSCSDDDDDVNPDAPVYGASNESVSIKSEKDHKHLQTHRSSDNFSTKGLVDKQFYLWTCTDKGAEFDVWQDVPKADDDVIFQNLRDGSITLSRPLDNLYISDPEGASGGFTVTCKAIDGGNYASGSIFVECAKGHKDGQSNRASDNFRLDGCGRYRVANVSGQSIGFKIMRDDSGTDPILYLGLKEGCYIDCCKGDEVYVANTDVSAPTVLVFEPYHDDPVANWMSYIPGSTNYRELTIPGTHDTGTYKASPGFSRCQNFDVYTQLCCGIRFLDIRLNDDLGLCHGDDNLDLPFSDVVDQMERFLKEHEKETILMSVKQERGSKLAEKFKDFASKNDVLKKRLYTGKNTEKLENLRGKIVLLRRFKNTSNDAYGVDLENGWPENGTASYTNPDGENIYIEDLYFKVLNEHDTKEKSDSIESAFKSACESVNKDRLYIVYNTISCKIIAARTPWDYAWNEDLNPYMCSALNSILDNNYSEEEKIYRLGIVPLDFFNKEGYDDPYHLTWKLINTNFNYTLCKKK